jgi:ABC-type dipeptide/oligopeptide/nickel transport system ATPase component
MSAAARPLLSVRLSVDYPGRPAVLNGVELDLEQGEILALVGRSGSGKSTLGLAALGLLGLRGGVARGSVVFESIELLALPERKMRRLRGSRMAFVPQSPIASLNPALRLETQLREAWRIHKGGTDHRQPVLEALEMASLPASREFLRLYPAQLSVGLAQRVLIAMAVLHRPSLLIADEPTSALDAITQAEILKLFADLNRRLGMAILYISHDLLSVAGLCHRVAILDGGRLVESGSVPEVFRAPRHPYARRLVEAMPVWSLGNLAAAVAETEPVAAPAQPG